MGIEEGKELTKPLVEFYLKNDDLGDPLLTADHIYELNVATAEEVAILKEKALQINTVLSGFFTELGINLIDFKLEFGKDADGRNLVSR